MQFLIKLAMAFFTELEQKTSKFVWRHQKSQRAKTVSQKKNGAGGIRLPDFRLYYKSQSSKQYGTGTKIEIQINGKG